MKVNKQTLFYMGTYTDQVHMFDIKTLSPIIMNIIDTENFCATQHESECIRQIQADDNVKDKFICLSDSKEKDLYEIIQLSYSTTRPIPHLIFKEELVEYVQDNKILNIKAQNGTMKFLWTVEQPPEGFKQEIARQLDEFDNSMRLLGHSQRTYYEVVGKYIILKRIASDNGKLTIPSFIEGIAEYALGDINKKEIITLLDGIKFIGNQINRDNNKTVIKGGNDIEYVLVDGYPRTWSYFKRVKGIID